MRALPASQGPGSAGMVSAPAIQAPLLAGALRISRTAFADNTAAAAAAGVSPALSVQCATSNATGAGCTVKLEDSSFVRNSGGAASAIYLSCRGVSCSMHMQRCNISSNAATAPLPGSAPDVALGWGVFSPAFQLLPPAAAIIQAASDATLDVRIESSSWDSNSGGHALVALQQQPASPSSVLHLTDCSFTNHTSGHSAVLGVGISAVIEGCWFAGNLGKAAVRPASRGAAAVCLGLPSPMGSAAIVNSTFVNNSAFLFGTVWVTGYDSMVLQAQAYADASVTVQGSTWSSNEGVRTARALQLTQVLDASITNCTFVSNTGGALQARAETLQVGSTLFHNNTAPYEAALVTLAGAALSVEKSSSVTVDSCSFLGNTAYMDAGAISVVGVAALTVTNSLFAGNTASTRMGGALLLQNTSASITSCNFTGNSAALHGGGLAASAGADGAAQAASITGCTFARNQALGGSGGAIYAEQVQGLNLQDTDFTGNAALGKDSADDVALEPSSHGGGAVACSGMREMLHVSNCSFVRNSARYSFGGAIKADSTLLFLLGSTLVGNTAARMGGAVYLANQNSQGPFIQGSVFESNAAGVLLGGSGQEGAPAEGFGGALQVDTARLQLICSTFRNNTVRACVYMRVQTCHAGGGPRACWQACLGVEASDLVVVVTSGCPTALRH